MVAVFIRHDCQGILNLLFTGQPIVFLKIKEQSFISRQKETYRTPYESQPKDRLRQCVFGGTSNRLDFLPLDRAGNRRFLPVMVCPEDAEVHILEEVPLQLRKYFIVIQLL